LAAVLLKPDTCSRVYVYVYDALQVNRTGPRGIGDRPTMSCAVRDWRSERISETREKSCDTRASRDAMLPVIGSMLLCCTYIGRPSSARVNR
jgi:hypothetical protein